MIKWNIHCMVPPTKLCLLEKISTLKSFDDDTEQNMLLTQQCIFYEGSFFLLRH